MRYTIAIALALLAGCAGTGPAAESSAPRLAADGSPLVCTREADVGSHMSRRVCRSEREIQNLLKALGVAKRLPGVFNQRVQHLRKRLRRASRTA